MAVYDKRYEKLRLYMKENGLDGVYVTSEENYLYLSGYHNPDGFMVVTEDQSFVFADFRYFEAAKEKAFPCCTVLEQVSGCLREQLAESGVKTLGFEDRHLTVSDHKNLSKIGGELGVTLRGIGDTLTEIRAVKEPGEIELIVKAQRIAERALDNLIKVINYDMTEIEVAAELEYFMKKNGSEVPSFDTIAVSGKASSVPHGVPRYVKLERGFLTLDFGATVAGYHSDMTRTLVIGKADEEIKKVYDTVLRAQTAAHEFIRAGVTGDEADKVARDVITEAGYGECFGHSLGHGVGLQIHELPNLSPKIIGRKLIPGNLITNEPGIYLEGKYGCRIEDMVWISDDGPVNLTEFTHDMIEI